MKGYRFVDLISEIVEKAAEDTVSEYNKDILPHEDNVNEDIANKFRDDLTNRVAEELNEAQKGEVNFFARVLSNKGANSEESKVGADLGIVYESFLPEIEASKGVLVQSKICDLGPYSPNCNIAHLNGQVDKMLSVSSDSFIFAFPLEESIKVFPALSLAGLNQISPRFPDEIYGRSIGRFFQTFVQCFIGDHRLAKPIRREKSWGAKKSKIRDIMEIANLQQTLYFRSGLEKPRI